MTRSKGPEVSEPAFLEYRTKIKISKNAKQPANGGITQLYKEIVTLRAQLNEAQGRLNEKLSKVPCTRAF